MSNQSVFLNYYYKNKKSFIFIIGLFLIGIILGIIFVNNANSLQVNEIKDYVSNLIYNIKKYEKINKTNLFFQSLKNNIITILIIWFLGCTIIGSFFIFVAIIYKGFSFGYTVSAIIASMGIKKGCVFTISSLFIQNLFFLPALFILAESGIRLYRVISKNRINLKTEVIRHSIVMIFSSILSIVASFFEIYISTNLLLFLKNIF